MSAGYGVETWCLDHLITGRYARGVNVVLQALYGRLVTPRGTLRGGEEEAAYGFDVSAYVGAVGYDTAVLSLPGAVRSELLKDDRVAEITVEAIKTTDADGLIAIELAIHAELADESADFDFTLVVTDVSVAFLGGIV